MTMRDKIEEIILEKVYVDGSGEMLGGEAADAILAALPPYMVAPLVWPAFDPSEQVYQQAAPLLYRDTYALRGTNNTGWNAYYGRQMISPMFSCHLQAQAAANDHHVSQIMATFGLTPQEGV